MIKTEARQLREASVESKVKSSAPSSVAASVEEPVGAVGGITMSERSAPEYEAVVWWLRPDTDSAGFYLFIVGAYVVLVLCLFIKKFQDEMMVVIN